LRHRLRHTLGTDKVVATAAEMFGFDCRTRSCRSWYGGSPEVYLFRVWNHLGSDAADVSRSPGYRRRGALHDPASNPRAERAPGGRRGGLRISRASWWWSAWSRPSTFAERYRRENGEISESGPTLQDLNGRQEGFSELRRDIQATRSRAPRRSCPVGRFRRDFGEISERWVSHSDLEVEIPPACGAYLPRRGWTSRIVGRAESLLAKPSSRMTLAAEFVGRLHGRRWWSTPRGGRPDLGGEVGAFTL
jgi:hypothetical protein